MRGCHHGPGVGLRTARREIFVCSGRFDGHPDLRRLLMWDGQDHPMEGLRGPDDYEYPTDDSAGGLAGGSGGGMTDSWAAALR
jgi:hypothetical protein